MSGESAAFNGAYKILMKPFFQAQISRSRDAGFTLVELAIVMLVIGLLIGGILKGQEMIKQGRIKATINQMKSYSAGFVSFQDKYGAMPGDMANATGRLPDCAVATQCFDGDGNGLIGNPADPLDMAQAGFNGVPEVETAMFWRHMLLADFIGGVQPGIDPTDPAWNATHPVTPLGGGFSVGFNGGAAGTPNIARTGNMIYIMRNLTPPHGAVLNVTEAAQIDLILDDGKPNSGTVVADQQAAGCKAGDALTDDWDWTNKNLRNCEIFYFID